MNPYKISVVKQISIRGLGLYSKPEKAARDYTARQCQDWWQGYLAKNQRAQTFYRGGLTASTTSHIDVALLHERQVRMLRRVLPIFKRMLQ